MNGLVKVSNGSSDLLINENCTLLQITPDVAHRTLTRLPDLSRHKCGFERNAYERSPEAGIRDTGAVREVLAEQ